ncbi:unnamed protein product, partial [Meganyctiphanes norvegica]
SDLKIMKWIQAPECKRPKITFLDFDMGKTCNLYYVSLRYENYEEERIYCGTDIKPGMSFTSTTSEIIMYTSKGRNDRNGWCAEVDFEDIPGCFQNKGISTNVAATNSDCPGPYNSSSGYFISPNYPGKYHADVDLKWILNFPCHYTILFELVIFDIEANSQCAFDYLDIRDGTNTKSYRYCGYYLRHHLKFDNHKLTIKFITDSSVQNFGFNITWTAKTAVCDPVCLNGQCTSRYICSCSPGWMGNLCDI